MNYNYGHVNSACLCAAQITFLSDRLTRTRYYRLQKQTTLSNTNTTTSIRELAFSLITQNKGSSDRYVFVVVVMSAGKKLCSGYSNLISHVYNHTWIRSKQVHPETEHNSLGRLSGLRERSRSMIRWT